jgi:hypothetical protein
LKSITFSCEKFIFSEDGSIMRTSETNESLFSNQSKENELIFKELHKSTMKELDCETDERMKKLYSSSLALVEREVAGGNTQAALAYLKTYHQCQAINLQMLNLILSGLQLPQSEKSCSDGGCESDEPNNEYLQSLEALLEPQEPEENGSRTDLPR